MSIEKEKEALNKAFFVDKSISELEFNKKLSELDLMKKKV
jgi:hypothetical protein